MIDGMSGRLPPIALKAAAANPVAPAPRTKPVAPDISGLASVTRDMAAAPPVDAAKVDRIRNALSLGTYKLDPDAVAERMIATDLHRG